MVDHFIIDGDDLQALIRQLAKPGDGWPVSSMRIEIWRDAVAVKIDNGAWSPPMGRRER